MAKRARRTDRERDLVHDWNATGGTGPLTTRPIDLFDETLRDGVQSPSAVDPALEDKLRLVSLMDGIGVTTADVGLPGAGPRAFEDCLAIARHVRDRRLGIRVACAARTTLADLRPVAEVQQRAGLPVSCYAFIGSSPIRQWAEDWPLSHLLETSARAVDFAVREGLEVAFVTEDTTRSPPATLEKLFRTAIDHGASRICLCDTVGHATPEGVSRLIAFARETVRRTGADVKLDWHGHDDRGLALVNALQAIACGIDRVHGSALGLGERVGNAPLDLILVNLKLLGVIDRDLTHLVQYVRLASRATRVELPRNHPVSGEDAFRTATGVHAAAIVKAQAKRQAWLADRVYSSVPAADFGREQSIEIGPLSGRWNVRTWLARRNERGGERLCRHVLALAKASNRVLTEDEVRAAIRDFRAAEVRRRKAGSERSALNRRGRATRRP